MRNGIYKNESSDKTVRQTLVSVYIIIFSGCFMLFLYEPILMYVTNADDFWFDFRTMIVPTLGIFTVFLVIGVAGITALYFINKIFSNRIIIYKMVVLIGFLLFLAAYIQGNFLVKNLPHLDGTVIIWKNYGKLENFIIITAVIIIGLAIRFWVYQYGFQKAIKTAGMVSVVVCGMLSVSLISVVAANSDVLKNKNIASFTIGNFDCISEDKNFVIFLVDAVDSGEFEKILDENREYQDIFKDFTYYTDTASVYPCTRESVPLILSGKTFLNENGFIDYCQEAYNDSKLFALLEKQNYDINLYDPEIIWSGNRKYQISNAVDGMAKIKIKLYIRQEIKYILFKYLPYGLKKYSKIENVNFNLGKYLDSDFKENNLWVYNHIINNSQLTKQNKNMFQYIHIEGAHVPYNCDKNLNAIQQDTGTYQQKIEASITVVNAYLQRLKENGVYDNCIVVVIADHGESSKSDDDTILERFHPILLIKGFDETHDGLIKSELPISHLDLADAYKDLLQDAKSTELFGDVKKGRTRKFVWYQYLRENYMVEYETDGVMKDVDRFRPTGNVYNR